MKWNEKWIYVNTLIQTVPVKRFRNSKEGNESRRCRTLLYYLKIDNKKVGVCKTLTRNKFC